MTSKLIKEYTKEDVRYSDKAGSDIHLWNLDIVSTGHK
jgi:hypothetical protein